MFTHHLRGLPALFVRRVAGGFRFHSQDVAVLGFGVLRVLRQTSCVSRIAVFAHIPVMRPFMFGGCV